MKHPDLYRQVHNRICNIISTCINPNVTSLQIIVMFVFPHAGFAKCVVYTFGALPLGNKAVYSRRVMDRGFKRQIYVLGAEASATMHADGV